MIKRPFSSLKELKDIQWRWVLLSGLLISVGTILIIASVIAVYSGYVFAVFPSDSNAANTMRIEQFAGIVGEYGSIACQYLLTLFVSSWVVRRVATAVNLHGTLIGFLGGVGMLTQVLIFSGDWGLVLHPFSLFMTLTTFTAVGAIGARLSTRYIAGQAQLYKASQAIQQTNSPHELINALGKQMARPHTAHFALWEILLQDSHGVPTAVSPLAQWSTHHAASTEIADFLNQQHLPTLSQLTDERPFIFKTSEATETAVWQLLGVRTVLLLPLIASSGNWVGLLTIGSTANSGFARGGDQDYITIGAQIGLVLDNIRLLAQAKETGVLQERQRMAREIHDTLAQGFTSIVMHLEAAEQGLPEDVSIVQRHLNQARQTARDSLGQARRVVDDLRPEVLESAPLHEAISRVVNNWQAHSSISTNFEAIGNNQPLHPEVEVTLLRGVQEALANVRKHAQAKQVSVTLSYLSDVVILDVADDGVGIEATQSGERPLSGGFGLIAMRERVAELGGDVTIDSEPQDGTTLAIRIPIGTK